MALDRDLIVVAAAVLAVEGRLADELGDETRTPGPVMTRELPGFTFTPDASGDDASLAIAGSC